MRSVTSSVYSVARARTGTSTSATSQTTEATLDTTQLYHGGQTRRRRARPARGRQRLVREHPPARPPRRSPFDDVTGQPPDGAFILADLPEATEQGLDAPARSPFGPDNARVFHQSRTGAHPLGAVEAAAALRLGDQPAAEREMRKPGALERIDGVLRRAHERFAVEVERGVEHGADAGAALELTDHPIVAGV